VPKAALCIVADDSASPGGMRPRLTTIAFLVAVTTLLAYAHTVPQAQKAAAPPAVKSPRLYVF
jgi:hypothetical protein